MSSATSAGIGWKPRSPRCAGSGARAIAVVTDVSDRASVENAAEQTLKAFGALHVACNNAGVTIHGMSVAEMTPPGMGLDHRRQSQRRDLRHRDVPPPHPGSHGGEGHIVNTASIAGFQVRGERRSGAYAATKFAVVALSESLAYDLADTPIGVSVLAPAAVKTRIYVSGENRPVTASAGPTQEPGNDPFQQELEDGLEPDEVGERVVRAIRGRELYVFTHMDDAGLAAGAASADHRCLRRMRAMGRGANGPRRLATRTVPALARPSQQPAA